MSQVNVYLTFNGDCAEAMNFYHECLGGDLILNKVEGSPLEAECEAGMKDQVMHSNLTSGGIKIMASDMIMQGEFNRGNSAALGLTCDSEEEIHKFYDNLSAGGTEKEPLKEQFWGAIFGMFTDKFGVRWLLNFEKVPA